MNGLYGEFVHTTEDHIQEAKGALLETMICAIRELAKEDDFWIVCRLDPEDPIQMMGCMIDDGAPVTVGWKVYFPHMDKES